MNGTQPIDLDEFKTLVTAAMTLAAAGLAGDSGFFGGEIEEFDIEVPYSADDKVEVFGGFTNVPFREIVDVLCDRFAVTHPRGRTWQIRSSHATISLGRLTVPSSHQVIAAVDALSSAFEGLGLHRTAINRLLLLRTDR